MENLWNNQKPASYSQSANQTNNQPTIIIINNIVMMISNWNEKKKFQNPPWKSWMVFFWLAVDVCRCLIMFDDGVVDPFNHSWIEEKQKLRKGQGRSFRVQASSKIQTKKNDAQNWTNLKNRKTEKNDKNYKIRITIMYISGYFFFVK